MVYIRPIAAVLIAAALLVGVMLSTARQQQAAAQAAAQSVAAYGYYSIHGTQAEQDAAYGLAMRALRRAEGR